MATRNLADNQAAGDPPVSLTGIEPGSAMDVISRGTIHSLGLREDGSVAAWGSNDYGQCYAPSGRFIAVSAGAGSSEGLREDGSVVGWSRIPSDEWLAPGRFGPP